MGTTPRCCSSTAAVTLLVTSRPMTTRRETICRDTGSVVVSVDYRLAPEDPLACGAR